MYEEERKDLDNRKTLHKTEEVEVDARLSDVKRRKDMIRQVESKKVSMQNKLSACPLNLSLVSRSTYINTHIYIRETFKNDLWNT